MGFFEFFSKEKKETLDKGLSKTKESVFSKITKTIVGKSKVDDSVLDELEEVLITSDVGVTTTLKIIQRIEKRVATDKYVSTNELTTILREEIAALLTENKTYNEIEGETGASTATISRINRALNYGADGYNIVLKQILPAY